ncbi:hypothetical protein NDU88_010814 [Pleurodeles waltl]|uniref:Uncharacterized protein n=1 Tax=Pleurodeles waltl TaxID=8319 RepID=A0AAV7S4G8_PLEWA|nr:hypothetical protein NDU88_010814 [Pleurodeles waltl]
MGQRLGRRGLMSRRTRASEGLGGGTPGVAAEETPRRARARGPFSSGRRPMTRLSDTPALFESGGGPP